jgi:chromosome segregation ATPase
VQSDEYKHLHNHFLWIQGEFEQLTQRLSDIDAALRRLTRLEIITSLEEMSSMAQQSEEIGKLSGKFDTLSGVVTDIHSDFEALRAAMEADRENLSDAGQAALDAANAKADSLRQQLTDLDVAVGDADGSDIPTGGGDTTAPAGGGADENPPADEPQPTV